MRFWVNKIGRLPWRGTRSRDVLKRDVIIHRCIVPALGGACLFSTKGRNKMGNLMEFDDIYCCLRTSHNTKAHCLNRHENRSNCKVLEFVYNSSGKDRARQFFVSHMCMLHVSISSRLRNDRSRGTHRAGPASVIQPQAPSFPLTNQKRVDSTMFSVDTRIS